MPNPKRISNSLSGENYRIYSGQGYQSAEDNQDQIEELKKSGGTRNPYANGTPEHEAWQDGWDEFVDIEEGKE